MGFIHLPEAIALPRGLSPFRLPAGNGFLESVSGPKHFGYTNLNGD
jgi:hypothetical protein